MKDSIHPRRESRSRPTRMLTAAALLSGVLVAGCGGSSPSPTAAAADASAPTSTVAAGDSTAGAASTGASAGPPGALAYARCMRANGVTNFPDPRAGGGFDFHPSLGVISSPVLKAAQAKCAKLIPGGGLPGSGSPPSAQTLGKLRRIAVCMRQHGVPQFPDPRTSMPSNLDPGEPGVITDFDGAILVFPATINLQAPAYKQALTACGAPPLGLPH